MYVPILCICKTLKVLNKWNFSSTLVRPAPENPKKTYKEKNLALVCPPRFKEMPQHQHSRTFKAQDLSPGSRDLLCGSVLPHSGVEVILGS